MKTETYETIQQTIPSDYKITKTYTYNKECTEYIIINENKKKTDKEELQQIREKLQQKQLLQDKIIHIGNINNEIIIQIIKK